ncbi:phospholipid-binding protein MlaC [Thioalkalivibrio sp. ALJ16]|uniref:MlaC/ttg2D family ABC transporter substrate-binding protein n=1 Tax=Thioalkalivibrio sp. ALJ16 TaxID=1158762 RepID=UPI00036EF980|nr:ABC transporter substrate-binding protein [Thioalkalivibrio sp. ALJ16]
MKWLRESMRILPLALLALLLVMSAKVQAGSPSELIQQSIDEVYEILRADETRAQEDPEFVIGVIKDKILPNVDVDGMARLVLARHWREASSEQRTRFTEAFTETLLKAYGVQLGDHLDKDVRVIERRSRQDDRMAVVATEVVMGSGQSNIQVNYRLRPVNGEWKVFDVEAEGLSFVGNFRTRFNEEINRGGLDALIERLEDGDEDLIEDAVGDINAASNGQER